MRHIEIRIKDIYNLDDSKKTCKSSNIYNLTEHIFSKFLFNIFYDLICKY